MTVIARKKINEEDLDRAMPKYPNQVLTFSIPIPPSVNHMYQSAGRGRRLTTQARNYIKTSQDICKAEIKRTKWKRDVEHVWYVMDMYFYFPDQRVRDSHNCIKLLVDCLEGLLFENDYFILPRIQYVCLDRENPRLEIVYYPQDGEQDGGIDGRYNSIS